MPDKKQIHSAEEMQKFGAAFAADVLSHAFSKKYATVVALQGELGAGKTTFAQGFARGLGIQEKVLSPTFVIVKEYAVPTRLASEKFTNLIHIDCYRLQNSRDLQELDWNELAANPRNIILLEWPTRVQDILPPDTIYLNFESINESTRQVIFSVDF
jgi:tRNA threonylcarbamoyladenosine biosynthesis protein TsaE